MFARRKRKKLRDDVTRTIEAYPDSVNNVTERERNEYKSDLLLQLAGANEQARVTVQTQRRQAAKANLDKVLCSILTSYHTDDPQYEGIHKRIRAVGGSVTYPNITETLRLIQQEAKQHASREDFDEHLATKITWLIKELSAEGERADISEEKCQHLNELLNEKEFDRITNLRKHIELQESVTSRVKEFRKTELQNEVKTTELEHSIRCWKDKYVSLKSKYSQFSIHPKNRRRSTITNLESDMSVTIVTQSSNTIVPTAQQQLYDDSICKINELTIQLSQTEAELHKVTMILDEVKKNEKHRRASEKRVEDSFHFRESEAKKRELLEEQWRKVLRQSRRDSTVTIEEAQEALRNAILVCSHRDSQIENYKDELEFTKNSVAAIKECHRNEMLTQQELLDVVQNDHLREINELELTVSASEFKATTAIESFESERKKHQISLGHLHKLRKLLFDNPTAHELLDLTGSTVSSKLPEVSKWIENIITFAKQTCSSSSSPKKIVPFSLPDVATVAVEKIRRKTAHDISRKSPSVSRSGSAKQIKKPNRVRSAKLLRKPSALISQRSVTPNYIIPINTDVETQTDPYCDILRPWTNTSECDILKELLEISSTEKSSLQVLLDTAERQLTSYPLIDSIVCYKTLYQNKLSEAQQNGAKLVSISEKYNESFNKLILVREENITLLEENTRLSKDARKAKESLASANNEKELFTTKQKEDNSEQNMIVSNLKKEVSDILYVKNKTEELYSLRISNMKNEVAQAAKATAVAELKLSSAKQSVSIIRASQFKLKTLLDSLMSYVSFSDEFQCAVCNSLAKVPLVSYPCGHVQCHDCTPCPLPHPSPPCLICGQLIAEVFSVPVVEHSISRHESISITLNLMNNVLKNSSVKVSDV